jgi:hypothetical protein
VNSAALSYPPGEGKRKVQMRIVWWFLMDLPDGQINAPGAGSFVQSVLQKYSDFPKLQISLYLLPIPPHKRALQKLANLATCLTLFGATMLWRLTVWTQAERMQGGLASSTVTNRMDELTLGISCVFALSDRAVAGRSPRIRRHH